MTAAPQIQEPDPAQRPARLAMYLGGLLIFAGLIALYLGYNGAATTPLEVAQTPYLISGGLVGVALVMLGAVVIAMHLLLRVQADFRSELRGMREAMDTLVETLSQQRFAAATHATHPSSNGTVLVARGGASFHRADCRLVDRAEHVRELPRAEVDRAGLTPCRVCQP